jgi:diadenosine tetraphosphate (Ap4A) HIT family hydrolase
MTDATQLPCLFCKPPGERIFFRAALVIGLWDAYPVSPGHALLIPQRHIPTWFEASDEERDALFHAIDAAKTVIEKNHRPDGYNIGINCGAAAGQTIFHLHIHLIPRFAGDLADPRGGVRHVIPQKANYLSSTRGSASNQDGPPK